MLRHVTTILAALLIAVAPSARAQSSRPQFEVASVKAAKPSDTGFMDTTPGRFVATGIPLRILLKEAYDLMDAQIDGGPDWINGDLWNVEGKAAPGETDESKITKMVQSLIEERFQLRFHRETRELPVYELTIPKGGPKMKVSANPGTPHGRMGRGSIEGTNFTVEILVKVLAHELDRPLIDKTALTGKYDMKLQWSREFDRSGNAPAPDQPGLFTALQEQLGLKLESSKGPVEVLVIDFVSKPTEN